MLPELEEQLKNRVELQKKRIEELEFLLKDVLSYNPDTHDDLNAVVEDNGTPDASRGIDTIVQWVKSMKDKCANNGSQFDSVFRAVSEHGDVFYFDPEMIEYMYSRLGTDFQWPPLPQS